MASNSGLDVEGYQEEIFLCVSAVIYFYDNMLPRRRSDPAADPHSAAKKLEGVYRRHITRGAKMVDAKTVKLAVKGLCREYVRKHGVSTLIPERKCPLSDIIVRDMFRTPDGASRGALRVAWSSYYWRAVKACFATLAEEGSRKDEVAKENASTPFRKGRFTFESLVWKIDGREVHNPTEVQLRTMQVGDGVWLRHGVAKNDPFGAYFGATPSFLAYRPDSERCACRELAQLEIAAAVPPAERSATPLFGPTPGEEFTHAQLDAAFELLLVEGAGVAEADMHKYSVHSFRIFVACALLAAKAPRWLIKRMLRWRGDESLEIYARVSDHDWARWSGAAISATVDASQVPRLPQMDISDEQQSAFLAMAHALVSADLGERSTSA